MQHAVRPRPALSFVVPVYGSPHSLEPLRDRISAACSELRASYELILVEDRCPKQSWSVIQRLARDDLTIVGIRLSRNFGQHPAINAGLAAARGQWIVVMDCDLQDAPEDVPKLLKKTEEGYDVVLARRAARQDPWHRQIASRLFYSLLSFLTETQQSKEIGNFGIYHRKVIDAILLWNEDSKYFPAVVQWIGFSRAEVPVARSERYGGASSYTLVKLFSLATRVIVGFSDRPLKLVMLSGFGVAATSFAAAVGLVVLHLLGAFTVEGWTSLMLSLWFLAGCMAIALGLCGLYIGRILVEAKGRPTFIIDEIVGQWSGYDGVEGAPAKTSMEHIDRTECS